MEKWQNNALRYLRDKTDYSYHDCLAFVENYWQNRHSKEKNLEEFKEWINAY